MVSFLAARRRARDGRRRAVPWQRLTRRAGHGCMKLKPPDSIKAGDLKIWRTRGGNTMYVKVVTVGATAQVEDANGVRRTAYLDELFPDPRDEPV